MITIERAIESFGEIPFIYGDVTQAEIDALTQDKWVVPIDGVLCAAVYNEVPELASKIIARPTVGV